MTVPLPLPHEDPERIPASGGIVPPPIPRMSAAEAATAREHGGRDDLAERRTGRRRPRVIRRGAAAARGLARVTVVAHGASDPQSVSVPAPVLHDLATPEADDARDAALPEPDPSAPADAADAADPQPPVIPRPPRPAEPADAAASRIGARHVPVETAAAPASPASALEPLPVAVPPVPPLPVAVPPVPPLPPVAAVVVSAPPTVPETLVVPPRPPLPPVPVDESTVDDPALRTLPEPEPAPDIELEPEPEPESEIEPEPLIEVEPDIESAIDREPERRPDPRFDAAAERIAEAESADRSGPESDVDAVWATETDVDVDGEVDDTVATDAVSAETIAAEDDLGASGAQALGGDVLAGLLDAPAGSDVAVPALRLTGVAKSFGATRAVAGIDLRIAPGAFYGIVGPNGAGKTTTLSMIAGLLRPDVGRIEIDGVDLTREPARAKRTMGVLPDRLRTFDRLTGRQLLHYYGALRGLPKAVCAQRIADLARAFDLVDALGRRVGDYSAGMTKKLMLAGAMIHSPRLLVLDEPFESVDPVSSAVILDILSSYVARGGTVVLSSHGMELVERVCTGVAVIVAGRVLAEGTIDEVRGGATLEERFVELVGGFDDTEGLAWLHTFSD